MRLAVLAPQRSVTPLYCGKAAEALGEGEDRAVGIGVGRILEEGRDAEAGHRCLRFGHVGGGGCGGEDGLGSGDRSRRREPRGRWGSADWTSIHGRFVREGLMK